MKISKIYLHIFYWILIILILVLIFGRSWGSSIEAFYFISLLLPIIIATSYFFNFYLAPRYLLQKKYFEFIIYSIYTIIISLFFELTVLIFTFTYLLEYNFGEMNQNAFDTLLLALVMYLIVFFTSTILMTKQLVDNQQEVTSLRENMNELKHPFLQIISQRKSVRIPYDDIQYIESYSDFIKIKLGTSKEIISKERLSAIEKKLPNTFLRIHRSFIVNLKNITRFDYNEVEISGITLNIGRTYKNQVLQILKDGSKLVH